MGIKKKLRHDDTIEKYNARFVANGSLAISHGFLIHHMNIKTALISGELEEGVYMDQPHDRICSK